MAKADLRPVGNGHSWLSFLLAISLLANCFLSASLFLSLHLLNDDAENCSCDPLELHPTGFPGPHYCSEMVQYHTRNNLHRLPEWPASLRGVNHTVERVCAPTNFTSAMPLDHNLDVALQETPLTSTQKDFVQLETFIKMGKLAWEVLGSGESSISNPENLVSVMPSSARWQDVTGWTPVEKPRTGYFNMAPAFFGTGAKYSFEITYDYGGHIDQQQHFLDNIHVSSTPQVGTGNDLEVKISYGNAQNCIGNYDPATRKFNATYADFEWPSGAAVACIELTIKFRAKNPRHEREKMCVFQIHGTGLFRKLYCYDGGRYPLTDFSVPTSKSS